MCLVLMLFVLDGSKVKGFGTIHRYEDVEIFKKEEDIMIGLKRRQNMRKIGFGIIIAVLVIVLITGSSMATSIAQDCITFDPEQATVVTENGTWWIVEGDHFRMDFDHEVEEAEQALEIIKYYGMNSRCFVGRPDPSMEYWLVNGNAPEGAMEGEDAIYFNPSALEVKQIQGRWKIVEGDHWLMDFDQQEGEARLALDIILMYDFSYMCYVGRPDPSMVYFRK